MSQNAGGTFRPTVIWVTHLASPYRVPVWESLAALFNIEVNVVEGRAGRFGSENRGIGWWPDAIEGVVLRSLKTGVVAVGRTPMHYLLPRSGRSRIGKSAVVLLGGWEAPVYWFFWLAALLQRRPIVGFYESTRYTRRFISGPVATVQKYLFAKMAAVVVPGVAAKDAVLDLGVPLERIYVGFNAVDVSSIAALVESNRRSHGASRDSSANRVIFVGQLIARKRVGAIVDAVAGRPNLVLDVVGEGVERSALDGQIRRLGCSNRVRFLGTLEPPDVISALASVSTLCLVSNEEVWGLVVNEALAAGLHVVVSERCGVVESVRGMRGVYIVRHDLTDLGVKLDQSIKEWSGPIDNPAMLAHSPARFAGVFADALGAVL